jgi:hypothetical protein
MLQVRLIPCPLTTKGGCWKLCLCLREPVRTQIHLANKSKTTPQCWRRALALLGVVTALVGPAFVIPRGLITENHVADSTHSFPIDRERRVLETLPRSARTSQNINSPSHQIKENSAILEASAGTVGRGDGIGGSSRFNPKTSFLSRKTMLQVPLIPSPLTAKGRCWKLCLGLREPVRT